MNDNVVILDMVTTINLPPDRVLNAALGNVDGGVVLVGYGADGDFYFASSISAGPEVVWLLELAKMKLLRIGEGEDR